MTSRTLPSQVTDLPDPPAEQVPSFQPDVPATIRTGILPDRQLRRSAVEICGVTKSFDRIQAVKNLTLRVPERTICGFIGPNGSGKTTTLRLIMRIHHPDEGSGVIRVLGEEGLGSATDRVGYLPEERGLYKRMKVADCLSFYAELKGCRHVKRDVRYWLERMGLSDVAHRRVEALSKGMAQKVQFIATVINRPELIILDEPFSGLDPVNTEVIRETMLDLRREGATIVLSTHNMAVAEKLCDFIVMMHQGEKVLDGTLDSIQRAYGTDTIRLRLADDSVALADLPGVKHVTDFGSLQELQMENGFDAQAVLAHLMKRTKVLHFEVARPSLHDIFVRIAGHRHIEETHA